jgi:hypothetical protein
VAGKDPRGKIILLAMEGGKRELMSSGIEMVALDYLVVQNSRVSLVQRNKTT